MKHQHVGKLVQVHVEQMPEHPALIFERVEVSYAELWKEAKGWASRIAPFLHDAEPVVGILLPRGLDVPAAQLATWMLGAAFAPLDVSSSPSRIEALLNTAECNVVITDPEFSAKLPQHIVAITRSSAQEAELPISSWKSDSLAYVCFTTGTTSTPKGVEIEHNSLVTMLEWYRSHFHLGTSSRVSMLACLVRDGTMFDIWGALSAGSTLIIPSGEEMISSEAIGGFLDRNLITHSYIPTSMFQPFLASGYEPETLQSVATGSDRLLLWPPDDYPAAVFNTYGPTETTVAVTCTDDLRRVRDRTKNPSIGTPVTGAKVWLEAADGSRISNPGVVGELVVAGEFVGRGYRKSSDVSTVTRFIDSSGERFYRTGDYCVWNKYGEIEFVGRCDRQVKIEDHRVELEALEHLLKEEGVRSVCIDDTRLVRGSVHGAVRIIGSFDEKILRRKVEQSLPSEVVARIVFHNSPSVDSQ